MRIASSDAPFRPGYFAVSTGAAVEFRADAKPSIQWNHIDGPMLCLRNGSVDWLTFWERFQCWIGRADAFTLERKRAPDFVKRWEARCKYEFIQKHPTSVEIFE